MVTSFSKSESSSSDMWWPRHQCVMREARSKRVLVIAPTAAAPLQTVWICMRCGDCMITFIYLYIWIEEKTQSNIQHALFVCLLVVSNGFMWDNTAINILWHTQRSKHTNWFYDMIWTYPAEYIMHCFSDCHGRLRWYDWRCCWSIGMRKSP